MAKQATYVGSGVYNYGRKRFVADAPIPVSDDEARYLGGLRRKGRKLFVVGALDQEAVSAVEAADNAPEFPAKGFTKKDEAIAFAEAHFPELMDGDKPLNTGMALKTLNEILSTAHSAKFGTDAVEIGGGEADDFETDSAAGVAV